jgi:hypothetical protein
LLGLVLLVADSFILRWLDLVGGDVQAVVNGLLAWLEMRPDVSVGAVQNILLYFHLKGAFWVAMIGATFAVPRLITMDLASNAILIYSSKAVNRFDYLLGKFGVIFGLLSLIMLGPTIAGWVMGNFLAPKWSFFWHSLPALAHAVGAVLIAITVMSALALGVSAASSKTTGAVGIWLAVWLLGGAVATVGGQMQPWLRYFSFRHDVDQITLGLFGLRDDVDLVAENIPLLGPELVEFAESGNLNWMTPDLFGAFVALAVMIAGAVFLVSRKVTTE